MTNQFRIGTICAVLALASCDAQVETSKTDFADTILTNAKVYTVDKNKSWADTVVVKDGKITFVGDQSGADQLTGPNTDVIDLNGQLLLPSFQDAHAHFANGGASYTGCPVYDLPDLETVLSTIEKCVAENPNAQIIRGYGWSIDQFDDGLPPAKELLDAIDSSRPLVFGDADGHALWANSKAFELYGITKDTPNPKGGKIEKDRTTGDVRGTVHEESAMNLIRDKWPAFTDEEIMSGIKIAQDLYHSLGITAASESIVKLEGRDGYRSLPALKAMNDSGDLKTHIVAALLWDAEKGTDQLDAFKSARDAYSDGKLHVKTIKFWADGVVETHTAMMLDFYADLPDSRGFMMVPRTQLMEGIRLVDAEGFQAHIHTIGDATARYALDAIEATWDANGRRDARHQVTHAQFVHPKDLERFAELDVGVSFQPLWSYEDDYITYYTLPRVGPERIKWSYPIGTLMENGTKVAFSSDWPVSSANPFWGIETAITRLDPLTGEGDVFLPAQRINLEQAIEAYTINAAYLNMLDETTGSIEVGKSADLVVLDQNLFEIPVSAISDTKVQMTIFEGEIVYKNPDSTQK